MALDQGKVTFRCKDVVQGCPWEVSGRDEDEIMPKIRQHGREQHNMQNIDPETEKKVRGSIQRKAA
jgi:predicted small metal-binding protein